ncbi:MAG: hypothetical protein AAFV53_22040 [Myxococcota bacterium]
MVHPNRAPQPIIHLRGGGSLFSLVPMGLGLTSLFLPEAPSTLIGAALLVLAAGFLWIDLSLLWERPAERWPVELATHNPDQPITPISSTRSLARCRRGEKRGFGSISMTSRKSARFLRRWTPFGGSRGSERAASLPSC